MTVGRVGVARNELTKVEISNFARLARITLKCKFSGASKLNKVVYGR